MRSLFIIALVCTVISSVSAQQVTTAEYFFDTDPGVGNGTPIPGFTASDSVDVSFTASTVGLAPGGHHLFIRYKDAQGKWGIYEGRSFYVDAGVNPQQNAPLLTQAEYFFDTDPGVGNGTLLAGFTANDTVDLTSSISAAGLSVGIHQLFIRYKDAAGKWGIYEGREFEVVDCQFPLAAVSVLGAACDGAEVMLSDLSTQVEPGATYAWDVDNDGVMDYTTAGDVMHTFPGPGTYTVELMVENTDVCKDSTTIEVTVNPVYNLSETVSICSGDSYTFPDGTTQNNITTQVVYTSNLQTVGTGCDSIVETTVNVNPTYNLSETVSVCSGESYTFPDGTTQNNITTQVVYTSNLQTVGTGCDSIVETTVNVNPAHDLSETVSVCAGGSYTFPDGTEQSNITSQVVYVSNLITVNACDSVITTTVNAISYDEIVNVTICSGSDYTFPDGTEQTDITQDVVQVSTLVSSLSCDSIITTNITVGVDFQTAETASVCAGGSYTFPDGTTQTDITQQVVYTSTLQATTSSCDSLVTTTVEVITVDTAVTVNGADLVANATNADYQWLDCDNSFSTITGADAAVFMPTVNGNYAVEVTQQGCADTSSCYNVVTVGLASLTEAATVTVYPNPTNGQLYVSYTGSGQPNYMLVDASGRMLLNGVLPATGNLDLTELATGIYQLILTTQDEQFKEQIIITK